MKRDLFLIKKILLQIEEEYINTTIFNLKIEGYTMQQVANHCELLYGEGLISQYKGHFASDQLCAFVVGNLTNEGFNYLDSIRDTDDLESHKSFSVNIDNSTNISAKKIKAKDSMIGGNNNKQSIKKKTDVGINFKLPKFK